ncbi:GNAT family N-acetyltransferase [Aquimarina hainanensis]|uniref:GNAT family N-acetyltransferase n=1 Tax=Aquimarina hainanensis TaxID=1578017 RepID=A0ABW5NCP7_9FLAO
MINEQYFEDFPVLETTRLTLRSLVLTDASEIYSIRSNVKAMQYMDTVLHHTIADTEKFVTLNLKTYQKKEGLFWVLIEKNTDQFIGDFSFWKVNRRNSRAEIGYSLHPDFWGKGYMKEAMKTILHFGFTKLKLHSIEANINPDNNNSRKVLKGIGFQKEAYFREHYYYNGEYLDSEIYSLLENDLIR